MSKLDSALLLAAEGFHVFRLVADGKLPMNKGWQMQATRDPEKIMALWEDTPNANIGIFTTKFGADKALVVIDEDNKGEKKGADTIFQLDFAGSALPLTRVQTTPTGGRHHIYVCETPVKQGANVLGDGLDIRSRGGYIVGAGSTIGGKPYTSSDIAPVESPEWLISRLVTVAPKEKKEIDVSRIDPDRALIRAKKYLEDAPIAEEGGRNETAFRVICELKDRGISQDVCLGLILEWNEDNEPPLEVEELEITVDSAYKTGQNSVGNKAVEAIFSPVEIAAAKVDAPEKHWFEKLNDRFALVMAGGSHHILWEMKDAKGKYRLEHLNEASFHRMLSYRTVQIGKKWEPETKVWMNDKDARRYDGLVFAPEREVDPRFFNMWRGFAVEGMKPGEVATERAQSALNEWLRHGLENVCNGDAELYKYMLSYFAHMIQRPWEKPLVSLVFKGEKGVGKNAILMFINMLLGHHSLTTAKKRYLTGNFNGHFEACLAFTLDEAMWGGDKEAEGALKDLITGYEHFIEHKGKEGYTVENLTRVFIIGNELWLVPASHDERRYAVFTVNNNKKQQNAYFEEMKNGMLDGGLRLLLDYLKNYKIEINVNIAPKTVGLIDQKVASLDPLGQWWLDCLMNGELMGAVMTGCDFKQIHCGQFRNAFQAYLKGRNITGRIPSDEIIGKEIKKMAPSLIKKLKFNKGNHYYSNGLAALRRDFEAYIKGEIKWPTTEKDEELECLT